MRRQWDINAETKEIDLATVELPGGQRAKAEQYYCTRIFKFRYVRCLPKYIVEACAEAGYKPVQLGYSMYKHSTWGLCPITRD
jgi:hypothetical protein